MKSNIQNAKRKKSSLPRSYPRVFPSKYPTSERSAAHGYTVRIARLSPAVAAAGAILLALLRGRQSARLPALGRGQVLRAALPRRDTGGPSEALALSVCADSYCRSFPLPPSPGFPFVCSCRGGGVATPGPAERGRRSDRLVSARRDSAAQGFPPPRGWARAAPELPPRRVCELQHCPRNLLLPWEGARWDLGLDSA